MTHDRRDGWLSMFRGSLRAWSCRRLGPAKQSGRHVNMEFVGVHKRAILQACARSSGVCKTLLQLRPCLVPKTEKFLEL